MADVRIKKFTELCFVTSLAAFPNMCDILFHSHQEHQNRTHTVPALHTHSQEKLLWRSGVVPCYAWAFCWLIIMDYSYEHSSGEVTKVTKIQTEVGMSIDLLPTLNTVDCNGWFCAKTVTVQRENWVNCGKVTASVYTLMQWKACNEY